MEASDAWKAWWRNVTQDVRFKFVVRELSSGHKHPSGLQDKPHQQAYVAGYRDAFIQILGELFDISEPATADKSPAEGFEQVTSRDEE